MAAVSVLLPITEPGPALPGLLRSLDAQTLPASAFEVVVVDASHDGAGERLRQLAGRRPNVRVVEAASAATEPGRLEAALASATGDHVLVLTERRRLAPRALELLLDRARASGADLVLGRVVSAAGSGCLVLPDGDDRFDPAGVDPADCVALVRRALVADREDAGGALLAATAHAESATAVSRYACAIEGEPTPATVDGDPPEAPAYRWEQGALRVEAGVRGPAPDRAWLVLADGTTDVALPATLGPDPQDPGRTAVSAVVDPSTALAGAPLPDGPWDLRLRVARQDRESTVPLRPGRRRAAVVDGRPHVVRGIDDVLRLDAGARRSSVVARADRSGASIAESVRGTLLTLRFPDVHVHGDAVLPARVLLDRFGLPARLVCEGGGARLEAYASSLAGTSALSVLVGGGRPQRTGLRLHTDGVGVMTVRDEPTARDGRPVPPLVQRVRRGIPGVLEPAASRLSRVPALRSVYRRLLSR